MNNRDIAKSVLMSYENVYFLPPDFIENEFDGWDYVPRCPICNEKVRSLPKDRDNYCRKCGQKLLWE